MLVQSTLDIGRIVANARAHSKITQSQLARAVGASQNWISEVEAGKPTAQIGKVLSVLNYLGIRLQVAEAPPTPRATSRGKSENRVSLDDVIKAHSGPDERRQKGRR
jgi:y4mF family transcriptional regulator